MPNRVNSMLPYALCKDLKYSIIYDLDLPFEINAIFNFHEIEINNLNVSFLKKKKRVIVLKSDRSWQESVNICGRNVVSVDLKDYENNKVKYISSITSLQIMVPLFEEEKNNCLTAFNDQDNRALLLSNIMYLIKYKFNEVLATDFNLDVSTFGAERAAIYEVDDNLEQLHLIGGLISPKYSFTQEKKMPTGSVELINNDSLCMWRYYANKCEISYNLNQNLDCILFAAIAIESYVNYIFKSNGKENHDENLFNAIKTLKQEGFLVNGDDRKIKSAFGKIKDYRNEIVHGRVDTVLQERRKATMAYDAIVSLFSEVALPPSTKKAEDYLSLNKRFQNIVAIIRGKDFDSQISELEWFADNGKFVQAAHFYLGICYFFRKELAQALSCFVECYKSKRFYIQSVYYLANILMRA